MYLGLDLALMHVGWTVLNKYGEKVQSGTIQFKLDIKQNEKKKLLCEEQNVLRYKKKKLLCGEQNILRLLYIENEIINLLNKYRIKYIAIEGYAYSARGSATINIGELGGIIRCLLYKKGYMFYIFPPTQVKLFATGKGNCHKDLILLNIFKNFNEEFKNSDEADSFVVAKMLFYLLNLKKKKISKEQLRSYEQKVLEKILTEGEVIGCQFKKV